MSNYVRFPRKFLAASTILLLSFFCNVHADTLGQEINSSETIVASGFYVVSQDITGYIEIDADNVCLNLENYRIYDNTSNTDAITVKSGHRNVTIKNGSVVGSGNGSTASGILIEQGASCINISDVSVTDCNTGFYLEGLSTGTIKGCTIKNCSSGDCNKGYLANYAIKSVFENCQAFDCVQSGFEQTNCQFNIFDKCRALKTGDNSSASQNVVGFSSSAGTGNLYTECVAEGTNKTSSNVGIQSIGLLFASAETESKILNCVINSTSLVGSGTAYGIYTASNVANCLIEANRVCNTTGGTGVVGDSDDNVFVKNISYENDVSFSAEITNVFTKGVDGIGEPNLLDNICLPTCDVSTSNCTTTINSSGVYKISDTDNCCIVVSADDVFIDLQGSTLQCTTNHPIQIVAGYKNIEIYNGKIEGSASYDGILVNDSCEFITIKDVDIYTCDNGINLVGTVSGNIKGVTVKNCNFYECNKGVLADYAIKSVFENCAAQNCVLSGFEQTNSRLNVFDKCKALQTGEGSLSSNDVAGFLSSAGYANLYTECVSEGTNKDASDVGADVYGLAFLTTETESKVCNCVFNSTDLVGSGTAYGLYTGDSVLRCLIQENKVCNTTGNATGVYGDSDDNVFMKNIGYNNDTNFSSGITNVFSNGLDSLFEPNLLDNISLPGIPTAKAINCPNTISASGVYNIDGVGNCCITIDADDVYLDLQGYTLNCASTHAIEIAAGHKNIIIKNGAIEGNGTSDGILVNDLCEFIQIEDVNIYSCDNAINLDGTSSGNIKGVTVKNCNFHECNKGVLADYAIKSVFENCAAQNCVLSGFEQTNSRLNVFDKCKALQTGEGSLSSDDVVGFSSSAGYANLYTECVSEGTNKSDSDPGADVYGLAFLTTETESKVCNCVFNSTDLVGSGTAYGLYTGDFVLRCLIQENRICNTTGNATGVHGDSDDNVFMKNIGYNNDTNFSSGITNVFSNGLDSLFEPNLLDNISLPGTPTVKVGTCPGTISASGVYNIDGVGNCCITIDSDDVYLDLQGYTLNCTTTHAIEIAVGHKNIIIKNGAIEGNGTSDGILVNNSCEFIQIEDVNIYSCDNAINLDGTSLGNIKGVTVKKCNFHECNKGVLADYVIKSVFENCVAQNCVLSGFEQTNSQFNVFDKCKALQTGEASLSSDDVVGFSSSAGYANLYTECVAEGTNKDSSGVNTRASGFLLTVFEKESKILNCVANSTTITGLGTACGILVDHNADSTLTEIEDYEYSEDVNSVAWSPNTNYLAIGGNVVAGDEVRVLGFDGSTLSDIVGATASSAANVESVAWSPNGDYLVFGSAAGLISVSSFSGTSLALKDTASHGNIVFSVDWSPVGNYIAVGGFNGTGGAEVRVLSFDGASLSAITTATYEQGAPVSSVDWSPDGQYLAIASEQFIAVGGTAVKVLRFDGVSLSLVAGVNIGVGNSVDASWSPDGRYLAILDSSPHSVLIYSFDGSSLTSTGASYANPGTAITSISWSPNGAYIALGKGVAEEVEILSFDGSSLTQVSSYNQSMWALSVDWSSGSGYLAIGSKEIFNDEEVKVFEFVVSLNCLIEANKVCNTMGNATGVYGDSDNNVFTKNIGYNNDTNFSSGITNVFSNGLDSLFEPNLLDNISLPGTPTAKAGTCPGTITASGVYNIDGVGNCCIIIDADDVYLDLQGYTLNCASTHAIEIAAGHKNIIIKNGAIEGNGTYDGILVNDSCEFIQIEDVHMYSCDNAINLDGTSSGNIKGVTVKNCNFHECNKGVLADYAMKSVFENCVTQNCVLSGFEQINCQFNVFDKCKALKTGEGSSSSDDVVGFSSFAGVGNLYTECVAEGTNKADSSSGADVYGLALLSTETESKVCDSIFNSTTLLGSGTAYGIYTASEVRSCLIDSNRICNTTGNATGVYGDSDYNVFMRNIGYENDTNFSSGVINVFTDGIAYDPNLLDNISLPGTTSPAASVCPNTISASGVYNIAGTNTCCVIIDADNVYLDLQGYTLECTTRHVITILGGHKNITIRNGSIKGNDTYDGIFTDTGCELVKIEDINIYSCDNGITFSGALGSMVKSCNVKNCNIYDCNKGVLATYLKKSVFENCAAKNCVEAGFEQSYSQFNVYDACMALETENPNSTGGAVGFSSLGGTGNLYTECIAEGTSVSDSEFCNCSIGFLLTGTEGEMETDSKIVNCVANSTEAIITVTTIVGTAYGIQLDPVLSATGDLTYAFVAGFQYDTYVWKASWSPSGQYLAFVGNTSGSEEFKILRFDGSSLTEVASDEFGSYMIGVSWSPNEDYIAVGGTDQKVSVYSFDGSSLGTPSTYGPHGTNIRHIDWSPDGKYIAFGTEIASAQDVGVLSFDGSSLSLVASYNQGAATYRVAWHPNGNYLAIGSLPLSGTEVKVLKFDGNSLTATGAEFEYNGLVWGVPWSSNGQYLACVGHTPTPGVEVYVLRFDGSSSLAEVASYNVGKNVRGADWSLDGKYLAFVTDEAPGGDEVGILRFDGSSLVEVANYNDPNSALVSVSTWSSSGRYLAIGVGPDTGDGDYEIKVFEVMDTPLNCLIENNKVCNTTGYGLGISGGENNLLIKNVCYENNVNFSYGVVPQYFGGLAGTPNLIDNLSIPPY